MSFSAWIRNTRMGYIPWQSGIMRRMLREEGGWQSHLMKTSEYIQQAINKQNPKSIRVLGSGWLLDIPIKYLMDNCEKVVLTDIFHPNQIINKYSKFKNIEFETIDITGGVVDLGYKLKKRDYSHETFIREIENVRTIEFKEDLVISVNLLSQLSGILTDYLSVKLGLNNSQIIEIAETIQRKHLGILPQGKSLLISDYEEEYYDEDDKFIGSKPTVYTSILNGREKKEWLWSFDTKMMYKEDSRTILRVFAFHL